MTSAEITDALVEQSNKLVHVSNLYYVEPQGRLAKRIVDLLAPGRVFFCNSGAEANEGLFKLARKFGHNEGRYEIITAVESFHGRTLAGIAATGQEKVKKGFEPMVAGFKQVQFDDLEAMRQSEEDGMTFLHPFDDDDVIAGQGTIGLELLEQISGLEAVIVPVGGGGLIGYGSGAAQTAAGVMAIHSGGSAQYTGTSTSVTVQFWNTSNVTGRFVALQLM